MSIKQVAQDYANQYGWKVFPVLKKEPLKNVNWRTATSDTDMWSDSLWDEASGYGIICDGLTVIDVDETEATKSLPDLKDTLIVSTSRGFHIYFENDTDLFKKQKIGFVNNIDLKAGEGSYVVGPGSVGSSGSRNKIVNDVAISKLSDQEQVFNWLKSNVQSDKVEILDRNVSDTIDHSEKIRSGARNDTLTSIAGRLRSFNSNYEQILSYLVATNNYLCDPPLPLKELETISKSVERYTHDYDLLSGSGGTVIDFEKLNKHSHLIRDKIITMKEILLMEPSGFIIDKVFPEGPVSVMYGKSGSLKSFVAMDWACKISDGVPLQGVISNTFADVIERKKVLYVIGEGVSGWSKRVMANNLGDSTLHIYPYAIPLTDEDRWNALRQVIIEDGYEVIFFDTLQKMTPNIDENSSKDIGNIINQFDDLYNHNNGICTVFVHHSNKGDKGDMRGSTAIRTDVSNVWYVQKVDLEDKDQTVLAAEIEVQKFKDNEPITFSAFYSKDEKHDSLKLIGYRLSDGQTNKRDNIIAEVLSSRI